MTHPDNRLNRATVPAPRSSSPQPPPAGYPLGARARGGAYLLLAVLGVVVGAAGVFVQALWFPGGLVLALAGLFALCVGGRVLTGTRAGAALPAAGWFAVQLIALSPRPEGDFLLVSNAGSYIFLLGGMILGTTAATMRTLPRLLQPGTRR
jgi:Family of unknown function (DUF6113)